MEKEHLEEFILFLANTKKVNSVTQYRYCIWIRDFNLSMLSQEYINEYVQMKGNHSQVRGAILNFLEMTGLNKVYDMPPKATGRATKRIVRGVSKEEIATVRDYLYSKSFRKGLVFDIVYQGALRRFECPTITINSFKWNEWFEDTAKPCRLIIKGKGDKYRTVLINPETAERILQNYWDKYNLSDKKRLDDFTNSPLLLFRKSNGKPLIDRDIWVIVKDGSIKALGRRIRTHELRHARATELIRLGIEIRDIKNYLGHSSLATTEIYLHTSEEESIKNISDKLK